METSGAQSRWTFSDNLAVALFCLGVVVAIALFWIDKTPFAAGFSITTIVCLMIFPILHFFTSGLGRRVAFVVMLILVGGFGWKIWPKPVHHVPAVKTEPQPSTAPQVQTPPPTTTAAIVKPKPKRKVAHPPVATPLSTGLIRGKKNTVVGDVQPNIEGDENTVVGATDKNGNTILTSPGTTIGAGACGSPGSIVIGAKAGCPQTTAPPKPPE